MEKKNRKIMIKLTANKLLFLCVQVYEQRMCLFVYYYMIWFRDNDREMLLLMVDKRLSGN